MCEPQRARAWPGAGKSWPAGFLFGFLAACGQGFGALVSRKRVNVAEAVHNATFGINAAYHRILAGLVFTAVWFLALHLLRRMPHGPPLPANGSERGQAWRLMLANGLAGPVLGASSYQ